jgi:hypothetical protein
MKMYLAILVSVISFKVSAAFEMGPMGAISGGGGKAVVCRDANGAIKSAEAFDLYEGRLMWGLNISTSSEPADQQILRLTKAQPLNSMGLIEIYTRSVMDHMRLLPADAQLIDINDSFEAIAPKNCKIEQLANYYNDNMILVNGEIWQALDETNRAALILHEATYAAERIFGAVDSRRSRHITSSLFDVSTNWTAREDGIDQIPANELLICNSPKAVMYAWAYKNGTGEWMMQFQILNGQIMSKKVLRLGNDFDLMDAKTFPILPGEDNIGHSYSAYSYAESKFENRDQFTVRKIWENVKDQKGQVIRGFQTPRYYLSWSSLTYPSTGAQDLPLNCSGTFLP